VVGSNIFNVLFILGIAALVAPLVVQRQLVRVDVPVMIGASLVLVLFALDGAIGRGEGGVLLALLVAYLVVLFRLGRGVTGAGVPAAAGIERGGASPSPRLVEVVTPVTGVRVLLGAGVLALVGLALLVGGSRLFVSGAVELATLLGVSQVVIGLTIIAAGTSLPEVATSVLASIRGERDIAVGNVVGSNVFNILGIAGACGLAGGLRVDPSMVAIDLPIMTAVALLALPVFYTGFRIERLEGLLLLGYYVAYALYLVMRATGHGALEVYGLVMMVGVVPLTVIGLLVVVVRAMRRSRVAVAADVAV
jgi:cation:H+ antiporter